MKNYLKKFLLQLIISVIYSFVSITVASNSNNPIKELIQDENKRLTFKQQKALFKDTREKARSYQVHTHNDLIGLYNLKCELAEHYSKSTGVKKSKKDASAKKTKKIYQQILDSIERTKTLLLCREKLNIVKDSNSEINFLKDYIDNLNLENELLQGLELNINNTLVFIKNTLNGILNLENIGHCINKITEIGISDVSEEEKIKLFIENKIRSLDLFKLESHEQKKTNDLLKIKKIKQEKSKLKKSRKKIQINDQLESSDESDNKSKGDFSFIDANTKMIRELPVHKLSSPFEDLSTLLREKTLMRK